MAYLFPLPPPTPFHQFTGRGLDRLIHFPILNINFHLCGSPYRLLEVRQMWRETAVHLNMDIQFIWNLKQKSDAISLANFGKYKSSLSKVLVI